MVIVTGHPQYLQNKYRVCLYKKQFWLFRIQYLVKFNITAKDPILSLRELTH